ncbi:MAG: ankyrin repeat domain-containing protein, partial [Ottowia sp.]|nr:ankyrin repeat domain-containing protein [Ottowia sp.]
NPSGGTALMVAAVAGHADIVRLLIASGANVNAAVTKGKLAGSTALDAARDSKHPEIVQILRAAGAKE